MKLILLIALTAGISIQSSQKPESHADCPMHAAHAQMNERGEKAMGFSQTATTHHFLLNAKGGVIQVEAKDSADAETPDGGRVAISSANKEAVEAIHRFLRFQIEEHKTGDQLDVR